MNRTRTSILLLLLLTSLTAAAISRTVDTQFGTLKYSITGVEGGMSLVEDNPRTQTVNTDEFKRWAESRSFKVDMGNIRNGREFILDVVFTPSEKVNNPRYNSNEYPSEYHMKFNRYQLSVSFSGGASLVLLDGNNESIIDGEPYHVRRRYAFTKRYDLFNRLITEGKGSFTLEIQVHHQKQRPITEQLLSIEEAFMETTNIAFTFTWDAAAPPPVEEDTTSDMDGNHREIESIANPNAGENSWVIPTIIGVIALGGGITLWNRRKRRREKNEATPPPPPGQSKPKSKQDDEDDYNERCTFEMRIMKDFGDSFTPGEDPKPVYARIVRITPEGYEITEPSLTAMIRITGDDYLQVGTNSMKGEYKEAYVNAPDAKNVPMEAIVHFSMSAEGVSFTNHVHFNIEGAQILFGQDNLTLPADYEKSVELPFVVLGLGENPKVTLTMEKDAYHVEVKKKKDLWFAVLKENKDCADFKNKLEPGKYSYYSLHIKATNENDRKVETDYPICRFQMGLTIDTTYIKCYIEEYDMANHLSNRFRFEQTVNTTPWNSVDEPNYEVKTMTPAETKCKLRLFEYDEESHQVLRIPAVPDEIKFEAVDENRQELVDKLGIDWEPRKNIEDGARPIIFRCIRHGLDAPLRVNAKMKVKTSFNNRNYNLEKEVSLHSQPVRQSKDTADGMAQLKDDERIAENLIRIQSVIFTHGYLKNLAPLDRYIQTMLDGYDAAYGYDKEQLRTVRRIWTCFLQGTFAGANAEAEKVTLGDELMMFFDAFMAKGKEVEDSLGFFSRMALGVFTLGCSEVVFTSMEVVREMKNYVDKGGDSVFGAFCCGVKVVTREYIMEKVSDLGMGMLKKGATKAGLTPENLKAKAKEYYGNITKGRSVKQAIVDTKAVKAKADISLNKGNNLRGGTQKVSLDDATVKRPALDDATVKRPALDDATVKRPALDDATVKRPALDDATVKRPALDDATVKRPALDDATVKKPALEDGTVKRPALEDGTVKHKSIGMDESPKPKQLGYDRHYTMDEVKMQKAEIEGLELGREKIENYRAAIEMLDDSPVNAKLKKELALEIQKDKNAMSLLANYKDGGLKNTRAKFNKEISSIHTTAELKVKAELAKELHVDPSEIKTFNASASTQQALKEGQKITYDHDVTFYYDDPKTGKPVFFDQTKTEQLYNRKYFETANEFVAAEQSFADRFAKKADQTVVQSDLHPESYGTENFKILSDKTKGAVHLKDADMVADAMTYKCQEWFSQGVKELSNPSTATSGIAKIREACRQCTKQYDNYLNPRNITRQDAGRGNMIPAEFHRYMSILKDVDVNKGGTIVKAKRELERYGMTFEMVFQQLGDLMRKIG